MNILIMGAAGSGKGTMSAKIINRLSIPHISTGDMFREALKNETELGKEAKKYMDQGLLVPDEVTIEMVRERLKRDDCQSGYLLDGFPRTLNQAQALEQLAEQIGRPLEIVINLMVSDGELIRRVTGRWICPQCGAIYHKEFNPPKVAGYCDHDGTALIQRKDDTVEQMEVRLKEHEKNTKPVIDYYRSKGLVEDIDGEQSTIEVFNEIVNALEKAGKND